MNDPLNRHKIQCRKLKKPSLLVASCRVIIMLVVFLKPLRLVSLEKRRIDLGLLSNLL